MCFWEKMCINRAVTKVQNETNMEPLPMQTALPGHSISDMAFSLNKIPTSTSNKLKLFPFTSLSSHMFK